MRIYIVAILIVAGLVGCASQPVPKYSASYINVETLKDPPKTAVGVQSFGGGPRRLSVRGHGAVSPVGVGFANYVQDALTQELSKADLFQPPSALQIGGQVIATDIDASASGGRTTLTVEFTVTQGSTLRLRKQFSTVYPWESSFIGAIAIPRAYQTYPKAVEMLLRQLYQDTQFQQVLRRN